MAWGQWGLFRSMDPPYATEMNEGACLALCWCLSFSLAAMGYESARQWQRVWHGAEPSPVPALCQFVRKMEEAEADLAGEHPWCAAATWCHRLPPAPRLLRLQGKVFRCHSLGKRKEVILSNAH